MAGLTPRQESQVLDVLFKLLDQFLAERENAALKSTSPAYQLVENL